MLKDVIRQDELEIAGVSFLRFEALLVVNKIESIVKEIERWIIDYEMKNGIPEFVKRKRNEEYPPRFLKEEVSSISPLQGGEEV